MPFYQCDSSGLVKRYVDKVASTAGLRRNAVGFRQSRQSIVNRSWLATADFRDRRWTASARRRAVQQ